MGEIGSTSMTDQDALEIVLRELGPKYSYLGKTEFIEFVVIYASSNEDGLLLLVYSNFSRDVVVIINPESECRMGEAGIASITDQDALEIVLYELDPGCSYLGKKEFVEFVVIYASNSDDKLRIIVYSKFIRDVVIIVNPGNFC